MAPLPFSFSETSKLARAMHVLLAHAKITNDGIIPLKGIVALLFMFFFTAKIIYLSVASAANFHHLPDRRGRLLITTTVTQLPREKCVMQHNGDTNASRPCPPVATATPHCHRTAPPSRSTQVAPRQARSFKSSLSLSLQKDFHQWLADNLPQTLQEIQLFLSYASLGRWESALCPMFNPKNLDSRSN
ncbi:hypothetical protein TRIUR3_13667 [Triticum urartu]|uniref:Uncharacterized protein n=1 Tax=Triticum urartu TaxID=4572 RepID=M7Z345_TRIUA|nr:hypothetical protein TRIUR3_13667 [Triticum urartu]